MKPYNKHYVLEKINEYIDIINENEIGDFKIKKIKKNNLVNGYMYNNSKGIETEYIKLSKDNEELMKISPIEIQSSYNFIKFAEGKVGIVGLGLGYVVQELLKKEKVSEIIVYEKEKEVIDLYLKNFGENKKVKIINIDAFMASKEYFDFFYVDIYYYELVKNVTEDYKKFKYLHNIKEYMFWGMEHFLLSCRYEDIVWVYIPELWMEASKNIFASLQEENLLKYYKQLDEVLVKEILDEFKIIFDNED